MNITETYRFLSEDFDITGRNCNNGNTFRNLVKDFERDFHKCHPSHYATFLFANHQTMLLLQHSCDADNNMSYGMDLIDGNFDPATNWEIETHSKYKTVYGIDSAYSQEAYSKEDDAFKNGAYPLTLLIDDKLHDGVVVLKYLDDDDDADEVITPVDVDVEVLVTQF
jgi:hypothetical protein